MQIHKRKVSVFIQQKKNDDGTDFENPVPSDDEEYDSDS
jgi:hypothetical protein